MNIISKFILLLANSKIKNARLNNAQKTAYKRTGEKIRKESKKGNWVDGKKEYRRKKSKIRANISIQHDAIGKIIK